MKSMKLLALAACLLPVAASAASRSSASYTVPADTIDAGGRRIASAAYTIDASIGGIGGIGTAPAPAEIVKHSYIGQLFDVRGLAITASPTTVNENATRQLSAAIANDDATTVPLTPAQVAWSVLGGPITSINAAGLATAGVVYEDEPATVRGTFNGRIGNLVLTVLNNNIDNYGSYAGDGIDDAWQVKYFGIGNADACASCDPDLDLQNNRFEYIASTDPTDVLSKFYLSIASVLGQPTRKDVIFSPRYNSRTYTVQYAINPGNGSFANLTGATTSDAADVRTVRDNNATNAFRFYRVFITFP